MKYIDLAIGKTGAIFAKVLAVASFLTLVIVLEGSIDFGGEYSMSKNMMILFSLYGTIFFTWIGFFPKLPLSLQKYFPELVKK